MTNIRKSKHQPITLGQNVDFYPKKSKLNFHVKLLNDWNFRRRNSTQIFQFFELSQKIIKHIILGAKIQTRFSIFFINFQKKSSKIYSKYFNILNFHKKKIIENCQFRRKNSKSFIKKLEFYGQKLRFCHSVPISQIK